MQNSRHLVKRFHGFIFSGDSRTFQEEQQMFLIRAVEPDFKKSNKKPDAKVGYRRLYPTFA